MGMFSYNEKTFLWGGLFLLLAASAVLFTFHNRALDPKQSGDWWAARFTAIDDQSSALFEVENYSQATNGQYQILLDGVLQKEGTFTAPSGTITPVDPTLTPRPDQRLRLLIKLGSTEQSLSR